jgi:hypothetical protein
MVLLWDVLGVSTMSVLATNVRLKHQGRREAVENAVNKRVDLEFGAEVKM